MELNKFIKEFEEKKDNITIIYVCLKDGSTLLITEYKFSYEFVGHISIYFKGYYIGHIPLKSIKRLV